MPTSTPVAATAQPAVVRRLDYTPSLYAVDHTHLCFELDGNQTRVIARLVICLADPATTEIFFDGNNLTLESIQIDGKELSQERYRHDAQGLTLFSPPAQFVLQTTVTICPANNTELDGLYLSNDRLCTQCEANGFRKITFFPDRPDVLSRYQVRLIADPILFPCLLSNGNLVGQGVLEDGRHFADWTDPFPKPSYLFALVAGQLACHEDSFITLSGRTVTLRIYHEAADQGQTDHAMASIKKAMRWDEEVFGLEYDLDLFMLVAVHDFNMGAMENKGLNIFNAKFVLASPKTATDADYAQIESVIGHEYFHNWTGNRVTCRDWFQLSLKEGLTVFRDQEFSADMGIRGVSRIKDVIGLRSHQFKEDSGPTAHPVRPNDYVEMNNLYTTTVYEKGAEVVRMYATLLGRNAFVAGTRRYLQKHDGQAATCDDFLSVMAEVAKVDLTQFERWYDQAGTPVVHVTDRYDELTHSYHLTIRQSCPPTPGQPQKEPFHLPFAVGLVMPDGHNLPIGRSLDTKAEQTTRIIELRETVTEITFPYVLQHPVPSLLRDFSAPIRCDYNYTEEALGHLMRFDDNDFARFEATRTLILRDLARRISQPNETITVSDTLLAGVQHLLDDSSGNEAFVALALDLPTENELLELFLPAPADHIFAARRALWQQLSENLEQSFATAMAACSPPQPYQYAPYAAGQRAFKNLCLSYLITLEKESYSTRCLRQLTQTDNMTDRMAAITMLSHLQHPERDTALAKFYQEWKEYPLVVDKWFALQAQAQRSTTLADVTALLDHPAFTWRNPNRVRALVGGFTARNPSGFHQLSGAGYQFLSSAVERLDKLNPQTAARLVTGLIDWKKFDPTRQQLMRQELLRLSALPKLSANAREVIGKALAD